MAKLTHFLVLKMDHFLLFLCPRLGFLCFRRLRCLFSAKKNRRKRVREEKQKKINVKKKEKKINEDRTIE